MYNCLKKLEKINGLIIFRTLKIKGIKTKTKRCSWNIFKKSC